MFKITKKIRQPIIDLCDAHVNIMTQPEVGTWNGDLSIRYPANQARHLNVIDARSFIALEENLRKLIPTLGTLWAGFHRDHFVIWGRV